MTHGNLVVVRHGRTAYNAMGRLQGRTDNPLDDVGREQAEQVARLLAPSLNTDSLIVSSPLLRARQTAEAISRVSKVDVEIDDRWIEIAYGVFEGVAQAEVPAVVWEKWRGDPSFAPESGESLEDVQRRVAEACEDLSRRLDGRTAVIVTHVSPIKSSIAWALGVDVTVSWRTRLDTASLTRIAVTPRGPILTSFNESGR